VLAAEGDPARGVVQVVCAEADDGRQNERGV
jgi:hypothetical protein